MSFDGFFSGAVAFLFLIEFATEHHSLVQDWSFFSIAVVERQEHGRNIYRSFWSFNRFSTLPFGPVPETWNIVVGLAAHDSIAVIDFSIPVD